jgi:transposase
VLKVVEWMAIRELARQGVTTSEIARRTGHDPKTIRKVLREPAPQARRAPGVPRASRRGPFEAYLQHRLAQGCLNATVLCEEIQARGYQGKVSRVRDFVRPIRQQWCARHGFVFTLGYSRALSLEFVTDCDLEHFLECHLTAFGALGIPEQVLYDNLKTAILGRQPDGTPVVPGRFLDFALYYGFAPKFCRLYRARTKGKVERSIGYVRQNFWVRVSEEVASGALDLEGLNARACTWVADVALPRVHGTTGAVVAVRLAEEQPLLGRLEARPRYDTAYHATRRVSRDGRLSYRGLLYQVPLRYALGWVEAIETLDGSVTLRSPEGARLRAVVVGAEPEPRPCPEPATTSADPVPLLGRRAAPRVEVRDLAVYEEVIDEEVAHGVAVG